MKKFLSAQDFQHDCWRLASMIRQHCEKPDRMLALWRGGAIPGVMVNTFLNTAKWKISCEPLICKSYEDIEKQSGRVKFYFSNELFASIKKGERVLIVDDVFDTGMTMKAVSDKIKALGATPIIACVYVKSDRCKVDLKADFFVRDFGGEWIVFPNEIEGLSEEEITMKDQFLHDVLFVKEEQK